jgi:hypothetical protein
MRKQPSVKLRLWFISITAIVSLALPAYAGTYSSTTQKASPRKANVVELRSLDQLKEAFQRDQGKVRLVTLLSPT